MEYIIRPSTQERVAEDFKSIAQPYFSQASASELSEASFAILRNSPSWGVAIEGASLPFSASIVCFVMASASSTAGSSGKSDKICLTRAAVSAHAVIPEPASRASAFPILDLISPYDSSAIAPFSSSGQPTQIAEGSAAANCGAKVSGTNAVTSPAPLLSAAFTFMRAAPGYCREPASTNACP